MNLRQNLKILLKKTRLLNFFYFLHDEIFSKQYFPIHISYMGYSFDMFGMRGDFYKSVNLYGCYEPSMTDKAIEIIKPGDTVFDIGCAEGYFTLFAAKLNKKPERIYGFDSSEKRGRIFKKNNRIALYNKAKFVNAFVSDYFERNVIAIDYFIKRENIKIVDLIKIDVEGAEVKVLKGALKCITKFNPHLLIEIHPYRIVKMDQNGIKDLCSLLKNENYNIELCSNHRREHEEKVESWREITNQELNNYCIQFIYQRHNFAIHCYKKEIS